MARYTNEFRDTIIQFHKLGKKSGELHAEYGIPKSTISTWLKDNSHISIDGQDNMIVKELRALKKETAQIKQENKS